MYIQKYVGGMDMKKILAILIALLAALAVQTVAFADGEMMPLQPTETQSETSNGAVVLAEGSIEYNGINYTVLTVTPQLMLRQ